MQYDALEEKKKETIMISEVQAVFEQITKFYETVETKMLQQRKELTEAFCLVGSPANIDITWETKERKQTLRMHAYGGGCQIQESEAEDLDVSFMTKEALDILAKELQEFVGAKMKNYTFGTFYAPKVEMNIRFRMDDPFMFLQKQITVFHKEFNQQAKAVYKQLFVSDAYQNLDWSLYEACLPEMFAYLLNEFVQENGLQETKVRLEKMLQRLNNQIADEEDCEFARDALLEQFVTYAQSYGFLEPMDCTNLQPTTDEVFDMLLYMGIALVRYEDEYTDQGKPLIEQLAKKKYTPAKQVLDMGSGLINVEDATWTSNVAVCLCNDVFKTITFKVSEESETSYSYMLDYINHLMALGFPRDYTIVFHNVTKTYLSIKSLHKSETHKFWANCVGYESLWSKMETYVKGTLDDTHYYCDGPEDDESPMATGGYAMLALAFAAESYGQLFADYLDKNENYDEEIFTDKIVEQYLQTWGVSVDTLPAFISCLYWNDELNPKKIDFSGFGTVEVLHALNTLEEIDEDVLELIVTYAFKNEKGLKKAINEASGTLADELQELLDVYEA